MQPGDIVVLRSGGPEMTVTKTVGVGPYDAANRCNWDYEVVVTWFERHGDTWNLNRAQINRHALKNLTRPDTARS